MGNNEAHPDSFWVYILECRNGSYYTGYTKDLARRYREHQTGSGRAKYTRSFKPKRIAACWRVYDGKGSAMRIEHMIKSLSHAEKDTLIGKPETLAGIAIARLGYAPGLSNEQAPFD